MSVAKTRATHAAGLDVRAWLIAGLFRNEAAFERFAIQTMDGGLSDAEALTIEKED